MGEKRQQLSSLRLGEIRVVTGPMFASKSSSLMAEIRRERVICTKCLVVGWKGDTRSKSFLKTHNDEKIACAFVVECLFELFELPDYTSCQKVFIDEAHFFPDLSISVRKMAHEHGKHVVLAGLYADRTASPFPEMTKILVHANKITFLSALCKLCGDGTEATYTKFIGEFETKKPLLTSAVVCPLANGGSSSSLRGDNQQQLLVGGADKYMTVCARHYYDLL